MAHSTPAQKSPRAGSKLRLSTIALVSMFAAVLMVTVLTAATGDNFADAVLGQIDFSHNGINNPGAASLNSPSQMAVDLNDSLYVVDGANSRILGWLDATSFTNGQPADIEIGQPDFQTTLCNGGRGGTRGPTRSLCQPGGVAVDSVGNLYVADTSNNRVLEYTQPFMQTISTGFAANLVFGQGGSFTQAACAQTATGLCYPQGLASDSNDNLYVADAGNHRVLEFNQPLATPNADTGAGDADRGPRLWTGRERHRLHRQCVRYRCGQRHGRRDVQSPVGGGRRLGQSVRRRRRRPSRARIQSAAGSARSRHRRRRRNRRPGFWPGLERNRFHRHHLL